MDSYYQNPNNQNNESSQDNFLDYYLQETGTLNTTNNTNQEKIKKDEPKKDPPSPRSYNIEDIIPFDHPFGEENTISQTNTEKPKLFDTKEPTSEAKSTSNLNNTEQQAVLLIQNIEENLNQLRQLLNNNSNNTLFKNSLPQNSPQEQEEPQQGEKIIIGHFDGEKMIGSDGKPYSVPANYASKSKLIDGDELKLTIKSSGAFVYKQTKPAEKNIITGTLSKRPEGGYALITKNNKYRLIKASITYYNGIPGDQITAFIPKNKKTTWAAVDNIIKQQTHGNFI